MAQIFLTVSTGLQLPTGLSRGNFKPITAATIELPDDWEEAKEAARRWLQKFKEANPGMQFHGQINMRDWV